VQILDGEARGIKFNRNVVITSQLTNGNKILNKGRRNKNIAKTKRVGGCGNGSVGGVRDIQASTVADDNGR
jgi:hypothetical protein